MEAALRQPAMYEELTDSTLIDRIELAALQDELATLLSDYDRRLQASDYASIKSVWVEIVAVRLKIAALQDYLARN